MYISDREVNTSRGKAYLERPLDRPFCCGDRDALHVESVVPRTRQRESSLCRVGRELEGGQEHGVALDCVVAQRARIHRDEFTLAGGLSVLSDRCTHAIEKSHAPRELAGMLRG